jgi:hypothetical protein
VAGIAFGVAAVVAVHESAAGVAAHCIRVADVVRDGGRHGRIRIQYHK